MDEREAIIKVKVDTTDANEKLDVLKIKLNEVIELMQRINPTTEPERAFITEKDLEVHCPTFIDKLNDLKSHNI